MIRANINDEIISSDLNEDELKKAFPKESFLILK